MSVLDLLMIVCGAYGVTVAAMLLSLCATL